MSTALAAAVLTVRACWSDPEGVDRPDGSEAVVAEEVVAVSAAASGVWGDGRALHAMALDANVTAVVSTTGVYLSEAGGPIDDLDQFGQPTEVGTVALSSDRSTLAIVSLWPSVVHWYDLVERRPAGVAEVGPGGDLFEFGFLGDTGVLTAVTPTGVSLWPTGPAGRITTPLTDARPTGRPTIVDDRLLVPIANSTDIAVVGPESVEWTSIAAPDDAVLLCVRSSPDVSTVGIAYFTPEIGDTIAVVDATSVDPIGTVSVGVPVQAGAWALTDRVVTVADGTSVIMWTHAGDWLGADQAPTGPGHRRTAFPGRPHRGRAPRRSDGDHARRRRDLCTTHRRRRLRSRERCRRRGTRRTRVGRLPRSDQPERSRRRTRTDDRRPLRGRPRHRGLDRRRRRSGRRGRNDRQGGVARRTTRQIRRLLRPRRPVLIDDVEFNPANGQLATGLAERVGPFAFDDTVTTWDPDAGAASTRSAAKPKTSPIAASSTIV